MISRPDVPTQRHKLLRVAALTTNESVRVRLLRLAAPPDSERYRAHAYLNVGQAVHDLAFASDFPGSSGEEAVENRAKSLALNLFYACINPKVFHDNLRELDELTPEEWLRKGAKEVEHKGEDKAVPPISDGEFADAPRGRQGDLPPFVLSSLDETSRDNFLHIFSSSLKRLDYPSEKIIVLLLALVQKLSA